MDENYNTDKILQNARTTFEELKECCDYISKLCKENLDILNNPFRFSIESDKLLQNGTKINLKFASLSNFVDALNNQDKKGDE